MKQAGKDLVFVKRATHVVNGDRCNISVIRPCEYE